MYQSRGFRVELRANRAGVRSSDVSMKCLNKEAAGVWSKAIYTSKRLGVEVEGIYSLTIPC